MRAYLSSVRYIFSLLALLWLSPLPVAAFETEAPYAVLMDYDTSEVLYEKEAHTSIAPSSMTKLMTTYIVFDHLKKGTLSLDDTFLISEKAWKTGGSKTFVALNDRVKVKDLLQGVIVQSGNDATIALAEGIAASETNFAELMNSTAQQLGLKNSHFKNASGWPEEGHTMSVYDLALLSRHLIHDFPEYYPYFAEKEFSYHNIHQPNRNHLLTTSQFGVDGLKTGHTAEIGYGIALSGQVDGRRLVAVVNGLPSEAKRLEVADALLAYGFKFFETRTLYTAGSTIDTAPVWYGMAGTVPLVTASDIRIIVPKSAGNDLKVTVSYDTPLPAPLTQGTQAGTLHIAIPDMPEKQYPLVTGTQVEKAGFLGRAKQNLQHYLKTTVEGQKG